MPKRGFRASEHLLRKAFEWFDKQVAADLKRQLAEDHAEWTAERIAARQQWMAAQATSIWRIAQLG